MMQQNRNIFYEKVHRHLETLGAKKRNLNAIRQKFKNLVQSYKNFKEHDSKCGGGRSRFKHGDIMDRIFGKSWTIVNKTVVQIGIENAPDSVAASRLSTSKSPIESVPSSSKWNKPFTLIWEVHNESLDQMKQFIKAENVKKLNAKQKRHTERLEQVAQYLDIIKSSINKTT